MWHFVTVVDTSTILVVALIVILVVGWAIAFGVEVVRSWVDRVRRPRG